MKLRKIITSAAVAGIVLLAAGTGVSQAATVPPGSHSGIIVERNINLRITNYRLQGADPVTGLHGYMPVGDGELYAIHWSRVSKNEVTGTGKYDWGLMGYYRNGPASLVLLGSNYRYTKIDITLTQSWYGYTRGAYPPYGHGAHHTFKHTVIAVNDPTVNLVHF